ncbi:Auxilin-related protein 1 [Platanthera guangdongensis]|uniref:Auxilin-related protein 1 n=1 Tax=Platanthera guangdongensis TaxID=2320717 RepID=A0ABR2M4W6_9ASPA
MGLPGGTRRDQVGEGGSAEGGGGSWRVATRSENGGWRARGWIRHSPAPVWTDLVGSVQIRLTQWDVSSEQQEKKAVEHPPKGYIEHDTNFEMNQSSPAAKHSYDVGSKKFMSLHRTSWEPLNVVISEKIQEAKLDAFPRDSTVADTNDPVHEIKNKAVLDEAAPHFSSSAKNSALNLKVDATPSESNGASLLVVFGDEKHHSRSSSYHSASSGDISVDDVTYLEVSEISLQTEPLQGPPPSRLPPEPSKKALLDVEGSILESVANNSMDSRTEANNIRKIDEPMKDISCSDNTEMDPHSAIALSMAAVKEAMEQAQARLKSAKELMDRKRERYRRMNGNEDTSAMDANNLSEKSKMVGESTLEEKGEIRTDGKTALIHEEITVHLPSYKKDQQMMKNDSSDAAFKTVEIPREWKREKKYYELTQNDRFFNAVKDIYIQEDEKKEKTVICSGEKRENYSKNFIKSFEVEENQTSTVVSFSMEKMKKDRDLNCPNMAFTEEADNNLEDASVYEFLLKDSTSKLEDAHGSHLSDDNQKMSDTTEDNTNDNKISELNSAAIDYGLHKESEKCLQNSNLSFEHEVDNKHCEKRQSKVSKGVSGYVEFERKFSASYLHSEVNDSYKEVTVPNEIFLQDIFVKEITVPDELFAYSTTDKKEVTEELKPFIDYVNETNMKHQFSYDGFRYSIIEKGDSAGEKNEGEGLQINEETLILEENELEHGVIQDEDELEYLGMQEQTKNELDPILNCRSGCHRDCNEKESSKARTFVQEDEESMGGRLNQEVETSDFLESAQRAFDKRSSEETTEATVPYISVEKQISLSSAEKTCQLTEIEESDTQVFLSTKEGNLSAPPQVSHAEMMEHQEQFCHEEDKHRGMVNIAHQQALAEAQKRAERIAVERVTAEARQRALADAREKAKKAAEAEKASREARLRAERAAVERATEEARRRAIEKALAEKAAAGIRERTAQVSFSKKDGMRKDNGTAHFKATHMKEDSEARHKSNSTQIPRSAQSQTASSTNGHVYSDSYNNGGAESSVRCKAGQEKQQQTAERAILAPESGWQPIPLADIINAPAVKRSYRKATLCVHPDKLQQRGATIQQKYICEKVFDLLKVTWSATARLDLVNHSMRDLICETAEIAQSAGSLDREEVALIVFGKWKLGRSSIRTSDSIVLKPNFLLLKY